jgi:hypothetical protein
MSHTKRSVYERRKLNKQNFEFSGQKKAFAGCIWPENTCYNKNSFLRLEKCFGTLYSVANLMYVGVAFDCISDECK